MNNNFEDKTVHRKNQDTKRVTYMYNIIRYNGNNNKTVILIIIQCHYQSISTIN